MKKVFSGFLIFFLGILVGVGAKPAIKKVWFATISILSSKLLTTNGLEKNNNSVTSDSQIQHLACIMDGNRRWAKKQGLVPWYGHKEGVEAVRRVIGFCLEHQIPYLSLYTFSLENFRRSPDETKYLFDLVGQQALQATQEAKKQGVSIRFIGDRTLFPQSLKDIIDTAEQETCGQHKLLINFLFCYGSQQEIADAARQIARKVKARELDLESIDSAVLKQNLWLNDLPDPEIIVRTGNVHRLSNFLLFQGAYSELYFLDCLWPEITKEDLEKVLNNYQNIKRNFGT